MTAPRLWQKAALAAEIALAYAQVRRQVRRAGLPATLARIRAAAGRERPEPDERLARAVRRTLRVLPGDSRCLMQSLVLTALLARRGRPARLVIGVTAEGEFAAHAWVERGGVPLLPTNGAAFGRLAEL